jgi:hypothetical protein
VTARVRDTKRRGVRFAHLAIGLSLVLAVPAAQAAGETLSGSTLKSFISGKRIYMQVPLGGELPLTYRTDGRVDGTGEAAGLGRYMTPKDSGRWWVTGDKLCQKWQEWYDGKTFCFTVTKINDSRIRWLRDDGRSGVARVR